jgi:hypothetical protein
MLILGILPIQMIFPKRNFSENLFDGYRPERAAINDILVPFEYKLLMVCDPDPVVPDRKK